MLIVASVPMCHKKQIHKLWKLVFLLLLFSYVKCQQAVLAYVVGEGLTNKSVPKITSVTTCVRHRVRQTDR